MMKTPNPPQSIEMSDKTLLYAVMTAQIDIPHTCMKDEDALSQVKYNHKWLIYIS